MSLSVLGLAQVQSTANKWAMPRRITFLWIIGLEEKREQWATIVLILMITRRTLLQKQEKILIVTFPRRSCRSDCSDLICAVRTDWLESSRRSAPGVGKATGLGCVSMIPSLDGIFRAGMAPVVEGSSPTGVADVVPGTEGDGSVLLYSI